MNHIKLTGIVILSFLLSACILMRPCGISAAGLDEIIEKAAFADGLILTGSGSLKWEYTRVDTTSKRYELWREDVIKSLDDDQQVVFHNTRTFDTFFAFKDNLMRCDLKSIEPDPTAKLYFRNRQMAYNGEKTDYLKLENAVEDGIISSKGAVRSENHIPVKLIDPRYNGMGIWGESVGNFLNAPYIVVDPYGTKELKGLQLIGQEPQDGIECDVISGTVEGTDVVMTMWLAASRNYRPKHIEFTTGDTKTVIHTTFKQYDGGVWFPKQITKKTYYINENSDSLELETVSMIIVSDDYEINIDVSDSVFEIVYPAGLLVYDERIGKAVTK
ncbi:MAG: hypothetical protein JXB48_14420 [Candidatus Latescibacteria bacterium]|nr:hypothetical protein [Candidatus Latescibacterota bacterium]